MSVADWDEDGFEPPAFIKTPLSDRWEGEDEDEDVKENWDDEEPEKPEEPSESKEQKPAEVTAASIKKKKSLLQSIAEKEEKEKKKKELKERRQKEEEEAAAPLTPEEAHAERLRRQKLQEEADLQLAKEAFGVPETTTTGIDAMHPTTKEDFDLFRKELVTKLSESEKSPHYVNFLDDFFRELCINLEPDDIKKLGSNLNALFNEKVKAQKSTKQKKKKKGASLNVGKTDDYSDAYAMEYADDYEDFI